jgi:hypothetical protein
MDSSSRLPASSLPVGMRGAPGDGALILLVVALLGLVQVLFGERLAYGNGFGWDGQYYGSWARDFYHSFFVEGVSSYYVQRVLPSAIVHYGMKAASVSFTDANIVRAFSVYQFALLLLGAWLWTRIARLLALSRGSTWFGFLGIYLSFALLKSAFYLPVTTDTSAVTLGMAMLYFYLRGSQVGVAAVVIIGAFTWPMFVYQGAILLAFPRGRGADPAPAPRVAGLSVARWGALALALAVVAAIAVRAWVQPEFAAAAAGWGINERLLPLSIALAGIYLFLAVDGLADARVLYSPRAWYRAVHWPGMAAAVALFIAVQLAAQGLANGEAVPGSMGSLIKQTLLVSVAQPLIFVVAHAVYFGPVVLLLILFWRPACAVAREFGLGYLLVLAMNLVLSLNSQTRFLSHALVFFVVPLAVALDRRIVWSPARLAAWALLCLVGSRVWYTMNTGPQVYDGTRESLLAFPLQHYFMNYGPWMSAEMYRVQGVVVLLAFLAVYLLYVRGLHRRQAAAMPHGQRHTGPDS